jgi:hypothetical protein
MLKNGLDRLVISPQQHHILVKRFNLAYQLDAVDQEDRAMNVLSAQGVKKLILQVLALAHDDLLG